LFFNLFNRVNLKNRNDTPSPSISSAGFGSIKTAWDLRIGPFALEVLF
jgi:hypothetical protein